MCVCLRVYIYTRSPNVQRGFYCSVLIAHEGYDANKNAYYVCVSDRFCKYLCICTSKQCPLGVHNIIYRTAAGHRVLVTNSNTNRVLEIHPCNLLQLYWPYSSTRVVIGNYKCFFNRLQILYSEA